MIGDYNPFNSENNILRNEIAISNLISIVNNPNIFNKLDDETKAKLVEILCNYAKVSVKIVETGEDIERFSEKAEALRPKQ